MKNKNKNKKFTKGFTLIELLVVVLIIGILAAVALPQYKKAVERTRMTEAITMVEKIAEAQQRYYMVNGDYTRDINDLDIDVQGENTAYSAANGAGVPAKQGLYFVLAASNASGSQTKIAVANRNPQTKKYAISVNKNGVRYCALYSRATNYEKELCIEWSNGNITI